MRTHVRRLKVESMVLAKVIREWPIALAWLAISNAIWEFAGSSGKMTLLAVALAIFVFAYVRRYVHPRSRAARARLNAFYGMLLVAGLLVLGHSGIRILKLRDAEMVFLYRVDAVVDRNYKLCRSTYMPEAMYSWLKRVARRPYYPQLLDTAHRFDIYQVTAYHIGDAGVVEVVTEGDTYGGVPDTYIYFAFQAETALDDFGGRVIVTTYPDGDLLRASVAPLSLSGENLEYLGFVKVPAEFSIRRTLCAPGAMSAKLEGFVFDLQNITHPPLKVDIAFFTDRTVTSPQVYRLQRREAPADWLLARPLYVHARLEDPVAVTDHDLLDSVCGGVAEHVGERSPAQLRGWRTTVTCQGAANTFLLRYSVEMD